MIYSEPKLSFLVLDYSKEVETRLCLESIKRFTRFEHKVIYLHNGNNEDYPYRLFKEGLIDHFIQTRNNNGLGIGTRDLFAACFSSYAFYLQNDQCLGREFIEAELKNIISYIGLAEITSKDFKHRYIASVDLAGGVCGRNVYSERAHIIETAHYKDLEGSVGLSYHGAGPYHDGEWREAQIQEYYRKHNFLHYTYPNPLAIDNGREAIRQNPDGSRWKHFPDTKQLFLLNGPVKERYIYPKLTEAEWNSVLETQAWEPGKIPEQEVKDSFHVWH
jgi:hypothetical protein